jgi:type I restriction-modification system DNA methylase subunit
MRAKDVIASFSGFRAPSVAAAALAFLHELSMQHTIGQPPREARWQRILERPEREWGAALDAACRACARTWPEQLDGFFGEVRFAEEPAYAVRRGVQAAERLSRHAERDGGPWDRRTLLASISQDLRSLRSKQWQGAFFTPWAVAEMSARMLLDVEEATELWVLEPCVGGAAMLLAALEVYRERHGLHTSRALTLMGVDINPDVCRIARASLLPAGADAS